MSTTIITAPPGGKARPMLLRLAAVAGALFLAIFLAVTVGIGGASAADLQCGSMDNVGGQGIDCHITVVNNLDLNDPTQTSSTMTITSCTGSAGPILAGAPCDPANFITTTSISSTLVNNIAQCNGSGNGGGGVVYCSVDVLNQITGTTTAPVDATVHECIGSATGAPSFFACDTFTDPATAPPAAVNTDPSTATVVQCDGSGNTDGGVVNCSVATDSTVSAQLPVTVNQCNGSGNGDGGVVICRVRIRTVIRSTIADTSYTTNTATFTPLPTTPDNGLAAPTEVVVPAIVVVPVVTPPDTPPTTSPGNGGSSSRGNRLVNTGKLASTGTNPMPLAIGGLMLLLFGAGAASRSKVVVAKRDR